jgi:hypothetical protein
MYLDVLFRVLSLALDRFEQFDPISEGVEYVHPIEPFKGLIGNRRIPGEPASFSQVGEAFNQECRMRLLRRSKVDVDAQMQPKRAAFEPNPAPHRQVGGLRFLNQSEDPCIKGARAGFLASWHGQLHVIESDDSSQRFK